MRNLKDYLHLYYGGAVYYPKSKTIRKLDWTYLDPAPNREWELAVRPLDELTEDEMANLVRDKFDYELLSDFWLDGKTIHFKGRMTVGNKIRCEQSIECLSPEQTRWLLEQFFDIFGLLEAGLAVNKTKVEADATIAAYTPSPKQHKVESKPEWEVGDEVAVMRQTGKDKEPRLVTGKIIELPETVMIDNEPTALIRYHDGYPSYYHKLSTLKHHKTF